MYKKLSLITFFALLLSACDDEYRRGYSDGKSDGYKEGKDVGYKEGHQVGYEKGKDDGYKEGHQVGYTEGHDAGYWEGTQFFVQDNALPTAGLGILIAFCFFVIGLFYKGWVYFFKEKWVRYSTLRELKKIKKSSIFKANMENKIEARKFAQLKEKEVRYSVSMLQLDEKISDIIINSYPKYDENSDINDLYIDIFKESVKSKELSNKHKIDIYSEILNRAKNLSAIDDNIKLS